MKVSLGTSDLAEALQRYLAAYQAVLAHWGAVRNDPQKLTHKTLYALAGQIRSDWINVFDENSEIHKQSEGELWPQIVAHLAEDESSLQFRYRDVSNQANQMSQTLVIAP